MVSPRMFRRGSRRRLIGLLRRSTCTVMELAQQLKLTDNAVRAQLIALQSDGLVEIKGLRRGSRRPSYVYQLTPAGAQLFPNAYAPVLDQVLRMMQDRFSPDVQQKSLAEVGDRLAQPLADELAGVPFRKRLKHTIRLLAALGADVRIVNEGPAIRIQGAGCPLSLVTREHTRASGCSIIQAMLRSLLGVPVDEVCQRGESPKCCFVVRLPPNTMPRVPGPGADHVRSRTTGAARPTGVR